jgi:hypothetical protein
MSTKCKLLFVIFSLIMLSYTLVFSQYDVENIKNKLPKLLGATNMGTDFWFTVPPCTIDEGGGVLVVKIYVSSATNANVIVEVPGKQYHQQKQINQFEVNEFNLTPIVASPWSKSLRVKPPAEKVWEGAGVHVYSDNPIIVYCTVRFSYTSDGFLVYPLSSLGKEYIVSSYGSLDSMFNGYVISPSLSGCVAAFDSTEVEFTLGGNPITKTVGGLNPGDKLTKLLMKGDVIMVASNGYEQDLTGSRWYANKPFAVVSGNYCANIPTTNRWCDYIAEMDLPTFMWGRDYHVPKIYGRKYASLIRIFAKEKNTTIFKDGIEVGYLSEAGGILNKGWLEMRMVPMTETPRSIVISSDKPVGITLCNTGVEEDSIPLPNSDPFIMAILPVNSYTSELIFSTQGIGDKLHFK